MKHEKGFSLIELMVVITIVGVLSTIALPKLQSFRANAIHEVSLATLKEIRKSFLSWDQSRFGAPTLDDLVTIDADDRYTYAANFNRSTVTSTSKLRLCTGQPRDQMTINLNTGAVVIRKDGYSQC
jgi:type IV pilus assembly protein PilA